MVEKVGCLLTAGNVQIPQSYTRVDYARKIKREKERAA